MCVASKCGRRVWSLGGELDDVISGQCVFKLSTMTSLPCFLKFFLVHHDISSSLHRIKFFLKMFFVYFICYIFITSVMQSIRRAKSCAHRIA